MQVVYLVIHGIDSGLLVDSQVLLAKATFVALLVRGFLLLHLIIEGIHVAGVHHVDDILLHRIATQDCWLHVGIEQRQIAHDGIVDTHMVHRVGSIIMSTNGHVEESERDLYVKRCIEGTALGYQRVPLHDAGLATLCNDLHIRIFTGEGALVYQTFNLTQVKHIIQLVYGQRVILARSGLRLVAEELSHVDATAQALASEVLDVRVVGGLTFIECGLSQSDGLCLIGVVGNIERGSTVHLGAVLVEEQLQRLRAVVENLVVLHTHPVLTLLNGYTPTTITLDVERHDGTLHVGFHTIARNTLVERQGADLIVITATTVIVAFARRDAHAQSHHEDG